MTARERASETEMQGSDARTPAASRGTSEDPSTLPANRAGLGEIDWAKGGGLVPVVVQDWRDRSVLMLGYADQEAMERTLATGNLHLWSRSRRELWLKGARSGNLLQVRRIALDCDGDTVLAEVQPATGETAICHTGEETCFYRELTADSS